MHNKNKEMGGNFFTIYSNGKLTRRYTKDRTREMVPLLHSKGQVLLEVNALLLNYSYKMKRGDFNTTPTKTKERDQALVP